MDSRSTSYSERTKGYSDSNTEDSGCYSKKKMTCCIVMALLLIGAIVVPTVLYVIHNEKSIHQDAQELLQSKQATENNYLLQIHDLDDKLKMKDAQERKLNAALYAHLEKSKGDLKAQEVKYENQIEAMQEKYDKQLEQVQIKLNVQIEQNRAYYAQIVQLNKDHLQEITTILDDFKDTRNSFNDIDNYVKKSKDKLQSRWDSLNKEKDKITAALKKLNTTAPEYYKPRN